MIMNYHKQTFSQYIHEYTEDKSRKPGNQKKIHQQSKNRKMILRWKCNPFLEIQNYKAHGLHAMEI